MCCYVIGHTTKGTVLDFGNLKIKSKEFKHHYLKMIVLFGWEMCPEIML